MPLSSFRKKTELPEKGDPVLVSAPRFHNKLWLRLSSSPPAALNTPYGPVFSKPHWARIPGSQQTKSKTKHLLAPCWWLSDFMNILNVYLLPGQTHGL